MSDVQGSTSSPDADDRNAGNSKTNALNDRYNGTLQMLVVIAGCLLLAQGMWAAQHILSRFAGALLGCFAGIFACYWAHRYSFGLPGLESMSQPDHVEPVTHPIITIRDTVDVPVVHTGEEKAAFNANRNAHEANVFDEAMQLNKELNAAGDHGSANKEPVFDIPFDTEDQMQCLEKVMAETINKQRMED